MSSCQSVKTEEPLQMGYGRIEMKERKEKKKTDSASCCICGLVCHDDEPAHGRTSNDRGEKAQSPGLVSFV